MLVVSRVDLLTLRLLLDATIRGLLLTLSVILTNATVDLIRGVWRGFINQGGTPFSPLGRRDMYTHLQDTR